MGDVITRFKLETTQFDSKLRDASKGISELAHNLSIAGKDFDRFAKDHVQTAKSFGNVASGATNLKDKLNDLVGAYNKAAKAYNALSKEQQESEFGKAMAQSLQTLQQRIKDTKNELNTAPGFVDKLTERFTVNIDAMKLFNVGLQAVSGALDVAKDAFFSNEENLDEWGRTVESSESLYKGFLNALNTGDISGYLSNIDNIVKAARDAYDAMDELNTFNAFNQVNVEKTRTSMTESIVDYREGNGTKEAVKAAGEAYKKELKDRQRLEKEAYLDAIGKVAAERGISKKDLVDALSGTYGHYQDLKKVQPTGTASQYVQAGVGGQGYYQTYKVAQNDQERLGEALRKLNDTEIQSLQALGAQAERTSNEVAQVDKQIVRVLNGRQGSGSSGGGKSNGKAATVYADDSIAWQEQEVARLTKMWKEAGDAVRDDYALQLSYAKQKLAEMTGGFNPNNVRPIADLTGRTPTANFTQGTAPVAPAKIEFSEGLQNQMDQLTQGGKNATQAWNMASQAVANVGNAFASIEDPGLRAIGTVTQAIASIALGFAMASSQPNTAGTGWGWLAWLAAGTAAMATTISTIHSLTGYAQGGIVKGNSYSGDNVPAMVGGAGGELVGLDAGEVVLTKAMAGNLAQQLQDSESRGQYYPSRVSGEQIYIALNAYTRRTGKGELVTWK